MINKKTNYFIIYILCVCSTCLAMKNPKDKKYKHEGTLKVCTPGFSVEFYKKRAECFMEEVFWGLGLNDAEAISTMQLLSVSEMRIIQSINEQTVEPTKDGLAYPFSELIPIVGNPENSEYRQQLVYFLNQRVRAANCIIRSSCLDACFAQDEVAHALNPKWLRSLDYNEDSYSPLHRWNFFFADMVQKHYLSIIRKQVGCYSGEKFDWEDEIPYVLPDEFQTLCTKKFGNGNKKLNRILAIESKVFAQAILVLIKN